MLQYMNGLPFFLIILKEKYTCQDSPVRSDWLICSSSRDLSCERGCEEVLGTDREFSEKKK
jgi:hypothetical protein